MLRIITITFAIPDGAGQMLTDMDKLEAFWRRVTVQGEDECWPWTGSDNGFGYGQFRLNGKLQLVHRLSYLDHGLPLPSGKVLRHECDNPKCVNPRHLLPGTQGDNILDAVRRGRHRGWPINQLKK